MVRERSQSHCKVFDEQLRLELPSMEMVKAVCRADLGQKVKGRF